MEELVFFVLPLALAYRETAWTVSLDASERAAPTRKPAFRNTPFESFYTRLVFTNPP